MLVFLELLRYHVTSKLHTLPKKCDKQHFGVNAKVLLDTVTYLFLMLHALIVVRDGFWKCFAQAEVCYLHCELHHIKSLTFNSFIWWIFNAYLDQNAMILNDKC